MLASAGMCAGRRCTHYGRSEPRPERVEPALGHGPPVRVRVGVGIRGVADSRGFLVDRRVFGSGTGDAASAARGTVRSAAAAEGVEGVAAQVFQAGGGREGIAGRGAEAGVRIGVDE